MRPMRRVLLLAGVATGAGLSAARRLTIREDRPTRSDRWLAVTVYRPVEEVRASLPGPLADLGDEVEIRTRAAPGDKGTEIAARLCGPEPDASNGSLGRLTGRDPDRRVRMALRRTKSLLETGDVIQPDPPAAHLGPAGQVVRLASRRAGGAGRL